jgi:hypothetical protein
VLPIKLPWSTWDAAAKAIKDSKWKINKTMKQISYTEGKGKKGNERSNPYQKSHVLRLRILHQEISSWKDL